MFDSTRYKCLFPTIILTKQVCLSVQIFLAIKDIAGEKIESQSELWERICRDDYMKYAVEECFTTIKNILLEILDGEGATWYIFVVFA